MRNVSSLGRKHDFRIRGDFNLSLSFSSIRQRNPTNFSIVLSRDDNFLNRRDGCIATRKLGTVFIENHLIIIRLNTARLKSSRPSLATIDVAHKDVGSPIVAGCILAPAGDSDISPAAVTGTCGGHHHGIATIRKHLRCGRRTLRSRHTSAAAGADVPTLWNHRL